MILTTQAQSRDAKHVDGLQFRCYECKQVKPVQTSGGTGYGADNSGRLICYACCGERDKRDMIKTGRATLYLTQPEHSGPSLRLDSYGPSGHAQVTNWPGTMRLNAYVRRGFHNIARYRYDAWFTGPDGKPWHGVTYGDNTQICHCKRLKSA